MKQSKISRRERRVKQKQQRTEQVTAQRDQYRKRQRNKKIFNYLILSLFAIAIAAAVYTVLSGDGPGQHDALARCLTQQGAIMYGTDWCPHCQEQKQLFGPSFKYVNYVNCDLNRDACTLAGVEGYPTWAFPSGRSVSGTQQLDALAAQAGCGDAA